MPWHWAYNPEMKRHPYDPDGAKNFHSPKADVLTDSKLS
jgi:hypothetical protein